MAQRIVIFGGRGFVGKEVCALLRRTHNVFTFDRHPGSKNHIKGDMLSSHDVGIAIKKNDIVINLVGLSPLKNPQGTTYKKVHVDAVKNIVHVCKKKKIKRFVHMSALGASKTSDHPYLQTKAQAENVIKKARIPATVFCPSVMYGKDNEIIKMISSYSWTRCFPRIPAKLQPVYVKDVAKLIVLAVQGKIKEKRLEIGGPETLSLFDMAKLIYARKGYYCYPIPLSLVKIGMHLIIPFSSRYGKHHITALTTDNVTHSQTVARYMKLKLFSKWVQKSL